MPNSEVVITNGRDYSDPAGISPTNYDVDVKTQLKKSIPDGKTSNGLIKLNEF